jgi:hypothetical protein
VEQLPDDLSELSTLLELSDVSTAAGALAGVARGQRVTLSHGGARVALARQMPFTAVHPKGRELRLDEVESGDADFDARISVIAPDWCRLSTREIIAVPRVREALSALLALQPDVRIDAAAIALRLDGELRANAQLVQAAIAAAQALSEAPFSPPPPPPPSGELTDAQKSFRWRKNVRIGLDLVTSLLVLNPIFGVPAFLFLTLPGIYFGWRCPSCDHALGAFTWKMPDGKCPHCGVLLES